MNTKSRTNQKITDNNIKQWNDPNVRSKRLTGMFNHHWGSLAPEDYYNQKIKPLIWCGVTFIQMQKTYNLEKSAPTLRKLTFQYGTNDDINKSRENIRTGKGRGGASRRGLPSALRGRKYIDILGSEEKVQERIKQSSDRMKRNNTRKYCTKISKPQKMLFELVREKYPQAVLEYDEVRKPDGGILYLDIAIPNLKIDIEYDGVYWHNKNYKTNIQHSRMTDEERDEYLTSLGWKVYRVQFSRNPAKELLQERLNSLNIG